MQSHPIDEEDEEEELLELDEPQVSAFTVPANVPPIAGVHSTVEGGAAPGATLLPVK